VEATLDMPAGKFSTRRGEIWAFLLLAVLAWPVLTIGTVSLYGFAVWIAQQVVYGPPSQGTSPHVR
jgi:nitrate reductase NapE component